MGKIKAACHNVMGYLGTMLRRRTGAGRYEGGRAVVSRITSAFVRAVLVMLLVATPSMLLPGADADGKEMVALVALFAGFLTFIEYNSAYPGLIEFRDAPPFNRVRFMMLFATILLLSVIARGETHPTTLTAFVQAVGGLVGTAMDFPYSPVRLATLMVGGTASEGQVDIVRIAAGMSYLISLLSLSVFVILLRFYGWPSRAGAFNVWVNLPTFDPTAGGDVVDRLDRDARVNIALGFLLPFLIPTVVRAGSSGFEPLTFTSPQTLIWTMAAWAFLPASLFMRGIAMGRIADMIREKRRLNGQAGSEGYLPA